MALVYLQYQHHSESSNVLFTKDLQFTYCWLSFIVIIVWLLIYSNQKHLYFKLLVSIKQIRTPTYSFLITILLKSSNGTWWVGWQSHIWLKLVTSIIFTMKYKLYLSDPYLYSLTNHYYMVINNWYNIVDGRYTVLIRNFYPTNTDYISKCQFHANWVKITFHASNIFNIQFNSIQYWTCNFGFLCFNF